MVINSKGGSGKSTVATNLASYFASQGKSVVIMDYDPQASSMSWLEARSSARQPIQGIAAYKKNASLAFLRCTGADFLISVMKSITARISMGEGSTGIRMV